MKRAGAGGALRDRAGLAAIVDRLDDCEHKLAGLTDGRVRGVAADLACTRCGEELRSTFSFSAGASYGCEHCHGFGGPASLLEAA